MALPETSTLSEEGPTQTPAPPLRAIVLPSQKRLPPTRTEPEPSTATPCPTLPRGSPPAPTPMRLFEIALTCGEAAAPGGAATVTPSPALAAITLPPLTLT